MTLPLLLNQAPSEAFFLCADHQEIGASRQASGRYSVLRMGHGLFNLKDV